MAKTYYYCDGNTLKNTEVSIALGSEYSEYKTDEYQYQGYNNIIYRRDITISIPTALPVDLVVLTVGETTIIGNIIIDVDVDIDGTIHEEFTILAGDTSVIDSYKSKHLVKDYNTVVGRYTVNAYDIDNQLTVPTECSVDPGVECNLAITGSTVTPPTQRGKSDGEIDVLLSGATGATLTYKLNGATITTTGNNQEYNFNLLAAGDYVVLVIDGDCMAQTTITVPDGDFATGNLTLSTLSPLVAAHNPIIINAGSAVNGVASKNSKMKFVVNDVTIPNNFMIEFSFEKPRKYKQRFYAKDFPNRNNYFLASVVKDENGNVFNSNNINEIAQSLGEVFQKDVFISQNYEIKIVTNEVYLIAREYSSMYNFTGVIKTYDNGSEVTNIITPTYIQDGTDRYDGSIVDNYSIYAELYVNTDVNIQYPVGGTKFDYTKVSDMIIPFNKNNRHQFDFSDVLQNYVSTEKPIYNFTGATTQPMMIRPYYVKFGELYPIIKNSNTSKKRFRIETDIHWTANSALDYFDKNVMDEFIGTNRRFVTNSPSTKQIQRQQNEYLYIIVEKNLDVDMKLFGNIYFYDGTSLLNEDLMDIKTSGSTTGGLLMLNLSYDSLGLDNYEYSGSNIKKIKYFDVTVKQFVSGSWSNYTETKRYALNINEQPRKFGVIFQNKVGTYDTFDFIGIKETLLDRVFDEFTTTTSPNVDGSYEQGFKHKSVYNTKVTKRVVVNTGYVDNEHIHWLREMLMSNSIYEYTNTNQNYLKVIDYKYLESSQDDVFDMEVTFEYTIFENNVRV